MRTNSYLLIVLTFTIAGLFGQNPFITTWQTSTDNESITIPTYSGETYNYNVNWGDGTNTSCHSGDATHTYTTAGTFQVSISGDFPRIYFNNMGDKDKIISIDQWGDIAWTSMESAFYGCSNLAGQASDNPDLSGVSDMFFTFRNASLFNQDISGWDVSNVTNMRSTFGDASSFNQDIGGWDVSKVVIMQGMFSGATSFNQDIGEWDVSGATYMKSMFSYASSFNQDISNWNVINVTSMYGMFNHASSFNQDISNWNVSNVIDMGFMFYYASNFNQNIADWNVSKVTNMEHMFRFDGVFNQDISGWVVSNVTNMSYMFHLASSFDQDLSSWDVSNVTNMNAMFLGVALSTSNYDAILIGWNEQDLQPNVYFHGGLSQYCEGKDARQNMIDNDGWTIGDSGLEYGCVTSYPFITTWQTTTDNECITIPTFLGEYYDYEVDWGDGTTTTGHTGDATHTYISAGTYQVSILGDFPRIYFNNTGDKDKIISIDQWGEIEWTSMENAFLGCTNLAGQATDTPVLAGVSSLSSMFRNASLFNQDIGDWDVSSVSDLSRMFDGATVFNQDIGSWNTINVTDMSRMFFNATSFDQDLSDWDVSNVSKMNLMFKGATLSTPNYDTLLIAWNDQNLQTKVKFHGGNSTYCAGESARQNMIDNDQWKITDDGQDSACSSSSYVMSDDNSLAKANQSVTTHEETVELSIFPNPVSDKLILGNNDKPIEIFIYDAMGRRVLELNQFDGSSIDLTHLLSGTYTISISDMQNVMSYRFMKI